MARVYLSLYFPKHKREEQERNKKKKEERMENLERHEQATKDVVYFYSKCDYACLYGRWRVRDAATSTETAYTNIEVYIE